MAAVSQDRLLLLFVDFLTSLMLLADCAKARKVRTTALVFGVLAFVTAGMLPGPNQVASQGSRTSQSSPIESFDHFRSLPAATNTLAEPSDRDPRSVVRRVQDALQQLGFEPGPTDGILGRRTRQAIKRFQSKMGHEPTGTLTVEQRKRLWETAS